MFWVLEAASIGLSLWEGYSASQDNKDQARRNMRSVSAQMGMLEKERGNLLTEYSSRNKRVTDKYGNEVKSLVSGLQGNMLDLAMQTENSSRRTGMSYSGTVEKRDRIDKDSLRNKSQSTQSDMKLGYEGNIEDLAFQQTKDMGQIDMQKRSLEAEYKTYEAQMNEKFLGIF